MAEILKESPGNDVLDTLVFILQPLRYLVKHAAFQEEQECRMLYITSLEDTRIKSEWDNKRMYLEYATPVKEALDKIYLSPGAQPHEDFFKKELKRRFPEEYKNLKYIGRLDYKTTGLLLLTNNGEILRKLTLPSSNIKRVYIADIEYKDFKGLNLAINGARINGIKYR